LLLRDDVPFQAQQVSSGANTTAFAFADMLKFRPDGIEHIYTTNKAPLSDCLA